MGKTIGDIMKGVAKPGATIGALLGIPPRKKLTKLSKADDTTVDKKFEGSYEEILGKLRGPLLIGSGCSAPGEMKDGVFSYGPYDDDVPRHYPSVLATFADHAYVQCSSEDKVWKVPFTIEGDTVKTGTPEEYVAVFQPVDAAVGDSAGAGNSPLY